MTGTLRDAAGRIVDPCLGYTAFGLPCPNFISVGAPNKDDIIPLNTLLQAAGVPSLDIVSGSDDVGSSKREQGIILILDLSYSNFCLGSLVTDPGAPPVGGTGDCNDVGRIEYTYRVFAVPDTQFQISGSAPLALGPIISSVRPPVLPIQRLLFRKYGLRLIVTPNGRVGYFTVQQLLINLIVSLGLTSVGVAIIEFLIFSSLCPLRGMFKQLKERDTVSISELRKAGRKRPAEYQNLLE